MGKFNHYFDRQIARELPHQVGDLAKLVEITALDCLAHQSTEPAVHLQRRIVAMSFGVQEAICGLLERLEAKESAAARHRDRLEAMRSSNERRVERAMAGVVSSAVDSGDMLIPAQFFGYFVYLLWGDDADTPLYVGQTRNLLGRISTHMNDKTKRKATRRVQLLRFVTERAMSEAEARLIRHYQPPLNKAGIIT